MPRAIRLLQALSLALTLSALPIATVSACSCAMVDFTEAVRAADVAIVATAVRTEPVGRGDLGAAVFTTWKVERSRDAVDVSEVAIRSAVDSGANCGITFGTGERWLVLAYGADGTLETNGCMQNRRLDGADAEADAVVAELLTVVPERAGVEGPFVLPMPLIGVAVAALLLTLVSAVAFRRGTPS